MNDDVAYTIVNKFPAQSGIAHTISTVAVTRKTKKSRNSRQRKRFTPEVKTPRNVFKHYNRIAHG